MNDNYYVCRWYPADSSFRVVRCKLTKEKAKAMTKALNDSKDAYLYVTIKRCS